MVDNVDEDTVQAPVEPLRGLRVVQVVFNTDPNAQVKYHANYPGARRNSGSLYSYITDQHFDIGDFAVVETPHGGLTVVQVAQVGEELMFGELPGHKWIIDKVDHKRHVERAEREKRKAFLLKSLSERANQIRASQKLEEVLSDDPASQDMLKELKALR